MGIFEGTRAPGGGIPSDHRLLVEAARLRVDVERLAGAEDAALAAAQKLAQLEASHLARLTP